MHRKITPERIGWLLSCKATENLAKGKEALKDLTSDERRQARRHAKALVEFYKDKGHHETQARLDSHPNAGQVQ